MPVKHVDDLCVPVNSSPWCRVITISMNKEILKVVETVRWQEGISRSELFRRAMRRYLEEETDFKDWCIAKEREYEEMQKNQPPMYNGKPIHVIRRLE